MIGYQDVGRFDIAMDDALAMSVVEGAGHRAGNVQYVGDGHQFAGLGVIGQDGCQVAAVHIFHDVVEKPVLVMVGVVNLDNVVMPPFCHHARFLDETFGDRRLSALGGVDDFDGNRPLEDDIASQIDLRHAAGTKQAFDAEVGKLLAEEGIFHAGLLFCGRVCWVSRLAKVMRCSSWMYPFSPAA